MKNKKPEVKKHILRFNKKNYLIFDQIRKGMKKVETRAAGPKYQNIQTGDILILVCGNERFEKKIKRVVKFRTVTGLFMKYPIKKVMPDCKDLKEAKATSLSYPGYEERLKKFGLMAFEI